MNKELKKVMKILNKLNDSQKQELFNLKYEWDNETDTDKKAIKEKAYKDKLISIIGK